MQKEKETKKEKVDKKKKQYEKPIITLLIPLEARTMGQPPSPISRYVV